MKSCKFVQEFWKYFRLNFQDQGGRKRKKSANWSFFCLSGRSTTLLLKSQYQSCKILFASIIPCLQSLILANNEYAELLGFYKKPFTFLLLFFLFSTISYAPTKLTEIILFQHLFHNQLGKPSKKSMEFSILSKTQPPHSPSMEKNENNMV